MARKHRAAAAVCASLLSLVGWIGASVAAELPPRAKPEEVGLSPDRLAVLASVLNADVEAGRMPGAVIAIVRKGKLAYYEAFGFRDKTAGVKMTTDTIFNIASMTKPMVAVGAMMLAEEGKLSVDDPVGKYLPALAKMNVAVLDESGNAVTTTVPAARPVTLQDLMRHTSGIVYGARGNTAVHKMYPASSSSAGVNLTGDEFIEKLASLPLLHQPATVWDYGFGLDVLGVALEKISGEKLGAFLDKRLFKPLGMTDTTFHLSPDQVPRYAKALPNDPDTGRPQQVGPDLTKPLKLECGGGCIASTAGDYLRFALMLLNHGSYGETRVLGRKTVEYMLSDQLGANIKNLVGNADPTRADYGFGLGLAVRTQPGVVRLMGSVGDFSWPGASGANWWADPKEELAVVFMAHTPGAIRWHYRQKVNALVYQALVN